MREENPRLDDEVIESRVTRCDTKRLQVRSGVEIFKAIKDIITFKGYPSLIVNSRNEVRSEQISRNYGDNCAETRKRSQPARNEAKEWFRNTKYSRWLGAKMCVTQQQRDNNDLTDLSQIMAIKWPYTRTNEAVYAHLHIAFRGFLPI